MSKEFVEEVQIGIFVTPLHTRLGAFDVHGNPVANSIQIGTNFSAPDKHVEQVAHHVDWLMQKVNPLATRIGAGVAVAGEVDSRRRKIVNASRLHNWINYDLATAFEKTLNTRVVLGNDAEARTRWLAKNDRRLFHHSFVTFFWGEGQGGTRATLLAHGHAFENYEPGHTKVKHLDEKQWLPCLCGSKGCLDAHSGGTRIGHVKATAGRAWLTDEEWQSFTDPVAAMLADELRSTRPDKLVLGGQRLNIHPQLRKFLYEGLERELPNHPPVLFTDLEYAPAHTAVSLLPEMAGSLR